MLYILRVNNGCGSGGIVKIVWLVVGDVEEEVAREGVEVIVVVESAHDALLKSGDSRLSEDPV